jgi:hypothetical protein
MALLPAAYVRQEKAAAGVTDAALSQRFIAESDKFDILASESELQKSWEAMIGYCGTIRCIKRVSCWPKASPRSLL